MSHLCPRDDCNQMVSDDMLACRTHWFSLPRGLRNAIWRTWRNGEGAGTVAHNAAVHAAIRAMNAPKTDSRQ
jgi:hypothetical protein